MAEFIWQLPNNRDTRYGDATPRKRGERLDGDSAPFRPGVSDPRGNAFNYLDYLHQIARAAELTGFDGIRISNDLDGDEPWIIAGYLARSTRRLRLLTEFTADRGSAVYAAKNAVSYQRFSEGRFAWQISSVNDPLRRRQQGDTVAQADQLPRIDEFLSVARGVIEQNPFSFKGRFFEVLDGGFEGPLSAQPVPRIYLSGNSPEALQLSARQADVHIFEPAPIDQLHSLIEQLGRLANAQERVVTFGLPITLLARESAEEAQFDAQRLVEQQQRLGSVPSPAQTSLVGSYQQVAQQVQAYREAGIDTFLLSAGPHLEEAYRIGENLLPLLRGVPVAIANTHFAN